MKWSTSFLSNFNVHVNHMLILKKCADSDSVRLEWGLRFCVSNKLLGDASIRFMNFTFSNMEFFIIFMILKFTKGVSINYYLLAHAECGVWHIIGIPVFIAEM